MKTNSLPTKKQLFTIAGLLLLFSLLMSLLFLDVTEAMNNYFWRQIFNHGHFFLFALVAYIVLTLLTLRINKFKKWPGLNFLISLTVCLILTFGTEYLQKFANREFEIRDILHNLAGVFFIHGLFFCLKSDNYSRWRITGKIVYQSIFWLLSLAFLYWSGGELTRNLMNYFRSVQQFPTIALFESEWELYRWKPHIRTKINLVKKDVSPDSMMLKIHMKPSKFPGFDLKNINHDWSKYRFFAFQVYNPDSTSFILRVRFDSGLNSDFAWITTRREVQPGWQSIKIPFSEVIENSKEHPFYFDHMYRIVFFTYQPKQEITFYLDNVRVE